jgi:hypothetical protein
VGNEARGTTTDELELYALLFARRPIRSGDEVKIVWRMSRRASLVAAAISPRGTPAKVTFGPESHLYSNFNRPGEEWGIGYVFDEPGCWRLQFPRDNGADIWLIVEP